VIKYTQKKEYVITLKICDSCIPTSSISEMGEFKFQSYREYVKHLSLDYSELEWLSNFLSYSGTSPSVTRVRIIDSIGSQYLKMQDFPAPGKRLSMALKSRSDDIQTRIVIVSYIQSWSIDRDVINTIGVHFQLDPWFLWGHLDHYYESDEALCKNRHRGFQQKPVEPLPSERVSVEIALGSAGISAIILDSPSTGGYFHLNTPYMGDTRSNRYCD